MTKNFGTVTSTEQIGGAAALDVGTTAGTVAAGDHTHVGGGVTGDGIDAIVALTQAEYDALDPPDAATLYVITG